jgi:NADH-quinone oxidoreductase subunit E
MAVAESQVFQRKFDKVNAIIERHGGKVSNLIAILQEIQSEYRYLPEEVLTYVATALGIPPATVYGVATFYAQFSLKPKGKYVIKVCDGTACHVRGSERLRYVVREKLGLDDSKDTTDDLKFTLETVSCIGACGLAPVVTVNDRDVHGQLTPEALSIILDQLIAKEKAGDVTRDGSGGDDATRHSTDGNTDGNNVSGRSAELDGREKGCRE